MGLATGKSGLVLAFDPNPYVYKVLEENIQLNKNKTSIQSYPYAITDFESSDFFYSSSEASFNNGGIATEQNNRHGKFTLQEKIKGIRLEDFLENNFSEWLPKLSLIKIDTEGYDRNVIKSIERLLVKVKPVVITECFRKTTPAERSEHFELLNSKGYKLFKIEEGLSSQKSIPIESAQDMNKWEHFDLFALPDR
jgi:FkbM family methyltransferase